MRIQTFSILAGSEVCNARCPFCISKMTPPLGVEILTDSLTLSAETEDLRQLIFFPDGHLRYDWQYPGAILL